MMSYVSIKQKITYISHQHAALGRNVTAWFARGYLYRPRGPIT